MGSKISVCIIGASGLVGHELHQLLSQDENVESIHAISRKPLSTSLAKTVNEVVDFAQLSSLSIQAQVYICCLGTTIKVAGSPAAFSLVDYEYVLKFAQLAEKNGATKFMLISALGADANSKIFYNQVKGQVEAEIRRLKIPAIDIFRPSLLLGERTESRPGEKVAQVLSPYLNPLLLGPLKKYRAIKASSVAIAMRNRALDLRPGQNVFESNQIGQLAL